MGRLEDEEMEDGGRERCRSREMFLSYILYIDLFKLL